MEGGIGGVLAISSTDGVDPRAGEGGAPEQLKGSHKGGDIEGGSPRVRELTRSDSDPAARRAG